MRNPTAFAKRNGYRGKGPTADGTANNQPLVRSAAGELAFLAFTANRALISDANGGMTHSSITSSELAYLAGLSGNVQTQLDAKAPLASPALTGNPTAPTQTAGNNSTRIATTAYCDTAVATRLAVASNLSDLNNVGTARTNLGLGSLAVLSAITKSQISDLETIATSSTANALVKADGSGKIVDGWLTANVPLLNVSNTFSANQIINGNLTLNGDGLSGLRLAKDASSTSYAEIIDSHPQRMEIRKVASGTEAVIDINPLPANGTSPALFRYFRDTNTTGLTSFEIHRGNGTNSVNCRICGNYDTWLNVHSGNVSIGGSSSTAKLDVHSDTWRLRTSRTPASSSATGNAGEWCWDTSYIYVCTSTNTWKRATLLSW